jgi:adenine-specific DNA-methyltransferase
MALLEAPAPKSIEQGTVRNGVVQGPDDVSAPPDGGRGTASGGPVRPVQFLGSKARVLPALLSAAETELEPRAPIVDVFSGSSLVAQGLARAGHPVAAFDALEHCAHFARALLGVDRGDDERAPDATSVSVTTHDDWVSSWQPWLDREQEAIGGGASDALIALSREIPQIWRPAGASRPLTELFSALDGQTLRPAGLVAAHYAGTYFGLTQAVEIDEIRTRIMDARHADAITEWQESLLLTALLSAASDCVFSAGKHYAQPHRIRDGKDLSFIRQRILDDRSRSLSSLFEERLTLIGSASLSGNVNTSEQRTLEELLDDPARLGAPAAIYADPPYAAQQYSRFYHVPEVICAYRVPRLQRVGGRVTRGLYPQPSARHKSRFCSRRQARDAFADLCRLAKASGAILLLSYSFSRSGETGNRRSIDLADLLTLLRSFFSYVDTREIGLTYRQFNAAAASVAERSDAEILIVARP